MSDTENIFGCFVSYPSLLYSATEEENKNAEAEGDLFKSYIWGNKGICDTLSKLKHESYGKDLRLALFQFYVKPISYLLQSLKEIEPYRKNEKAIGIPIIVNDENFFNKSEEGRYSFLKQSILQKLDLLGEVVKKKKLDTKMEQLKADLEKILN